MKFSSAFSAPAIAASTLITLSTIAFAISQPKSISANMDSQSPQISEHSTQKISGRSCSILDPLCGWWRIFGLT